MKSNLAEIKKDINGMKKANEEARKYLENINKKIAELDLRYAKMLVKDDISQLKTAKKILQKRKKK